MFILCRFTVRRLACASPVHTHVPLSIALVFQGTEDRAHGSHLRSIGPLSGTTLLSVAVCRFSAKASPPSVLHDSIMQNMQNISQDQ